jgi:protein TonB
MLPGSPSPIYPEALRSAGMEGRVVAEFVIDTMGRAELATFRAVESAHKLFTRAVRDALVRMRFAPAEAHGRLVRVLVRQDFVFELGF